MGPFKELSKYIRNFINSGGNLDNIQSISAHWLYGTDINKLVKLSHSGLVYNPPGH